MTIHHPRTMDQNTEQSPDAALQGARRATENAASGGAPPDPEVVATARRRSFPAAEKLRILAAADACTQPGEIGALLRREGIYSSSLSQWRKQRDKGAITALKPQKRGRRADPVRAESRRNEALTREVATLRRQLAQAELIIDVQKKVATLLGMSTMPANGEES